MKTIYHSEQFTDDFEINFSEKNDCKGVVKFEIHPHELSVPLLIKDGSGQRITAQAPFVINTNHPIVDGLIRFEFSEYPALTAVQTTPFKKAIVRYLYCE